MSDESSTLIDRDFVPNQSHSYNTIEQGQNEGSRIGTKVVDISYSEIYNTKIIASEVYKSFIMSVPLVMGCIIEYMNPFITTYSVGWLGTKELASAALSSMFSSMTGWSIAYGMVTALDTLCSQSYTGSEDKKMVGVYAQRGFYVSMLLFVPISFLWWHAEYLLLAIGQDAELARLCGLYLRYLLPCVPSFIAMECIKKFLQAQGIMNASVTILSFGLPVCCLLNYLLVWYPPTSLGFIGAPIASSLTNYFYLFSFVFYVKFINGGEAWGGFSYEGLKGWKQVFKLGFPGVVMICSEWWSYELMAFAASYLGSNPLAAHAAISGMSNIIYQFNYGIGIVASNRVGNALGENRPNKALQVSAAQFIFGGVVSLFLCVSILIFEPFLKTLYTNDPNLVPIIQKLIPILALFQLGDLIGGTGGGILRGLGRQDLGAQIYLFIFYIIAIPTGVYLAFPFGFDLGIEGLWLGFTLGATLIGLLILYVVTFKIDWIKEAELASVNLNNDSSNSV